MSSSNSFNTSRAIGPATLPPLSPFSTITAIEYLGSSKGAYPMNIAWSLRLGFSLTSSYSSVELISTTWAVPLLPARFKLPALIL